MMLDTLTINGEQPPLVGLPCEEMLASECRIEGEPVDPANVVYLRFAESWHRLYFDYGIVFWRPYDQSPESVTLGERDPTFLLVDLANRFGVRGVVLERLESAPIEDGAEVRFAFRNGVNLVFSCVADITTYRAEPRVAPDCGDIT